MGRKANTLGTMNWTRERSRGGEEGRELFEWVGGGVDGGEGGGLNELLGAIGGLPVICCEHVNQDVYSSLKQSVIPSSTALCNHSECVQQHLVIDQLRSREFLMFG